MTHPDPNLQLVTVYESDDPISFNLAKSALEDAGVEFAEVRDALTGYGFSPIINPQSRILVAAENEPRAREAIAPQAE